MPRVKGHCVAMSAIFFFFFFFGGGGGGGGGEINRSGTNLGSFYTVHDPGFT